MYDQEIAIIKADLGIQALQIEWEWLQRHRIRGKTCGTYYHRDGKPKIAIAVKGWTFRQNVEMIAHELRHAWQWATLTYHPETLAWRGTQYCGPVRRCPPQQRYRKRPIEIDAYGYQADVWGRLFANVPAKKAVPTPQSTLAAMFSAAW